VYFSDAKEARIKEVASISDQDVLQLFRLHGDLQALGLKVLGIGLPAIRDSWSQVTAARKQAGGGHCRLGEGIRRYKDCDKRRSGRAKVQYVPER